MHDDDHVSCNKVIEFTYAVLSSVKFGDSLGLVGVVFGAGNEWLSTLGHNICSAGIPGGELHTLLFLFSCRIKILQMEIFSASALFRSLFLPWALAYKLV